MYPMNHVLMESKMEAAARHAYLEVVNPSLYRDFGHNEYFNKFCSHLSREGITFERQKVIQGKIPDIFIPNYGVVEVKAKSSGITQADINQCQVYAQMAGNCMLINFGTQHGPHFRKF